jgi:hypothetical protein
VGDDVTTVKGTAKRYSQEEIDAFYKQRYDMDFTKMTPEQRTAADRALEAASAPPVVVVNGKIQINPLRQKIMQGGGFSPSQAKLLSLYGSYKAGTLPEQLDHERLKKSGVKDEDLERIGKERHDTWAKGVETRFDQFVNPKLEEGKKQPTKAKPTMNFEPEVIEASPKTDRGTSKAKGKEGEMAPQPVTPDPQAVTASPPPSAPIAGPALPDAVAQPMPAPVQAMPNPNQFSAQINQGGVMVPAQLVQEPQ